MPGSCGDSGDDRRAVQGPIADGSEPPETGTLYERVGGDRWFVRLVDHFYDGVETDPVLRPLYPADLKGPRDRLAMFLAQYFGGPSAYNAARGLPRLRMRHVHFTIGSIERDAWLGHMIQAVRAGGLGDNDEDDVLRYFVSTATMLMSAGGGVKMPPLTVVRRRVPGVEVQSDQRLQPVREEGGTRGGQHRPGCDVEDD